MVTYGFPIWDLSFLNLSRQLFFWFQKHPLGSTFFGSRNFLLWRKDGWDGMDGRETFFFKLISRKLLTIFSNLFRILLECVSRYVLRKTQKKLKKLDFSKIFAKIGGYFFFRFFEHKFANFSKTTWYFFLIVFAPLRRLFKTSSAKKSKKTKNFKYAKNRLTTQFWAIFRHFSILKGIPYKKIKGISFVKFKGISFVLNGSPARAVS